MRLSVTDPSGRTGSRRVHDVVRSQGVERADLRPGPGTTVLALASPGANDRFPGVGAMSHPVAAIPVAEAAEKPQERREADLLADVNLPTAPRRNSRKGVLVTPPGVLGNRPTLPTPRSLSADPVRPIGPATVTAKGFERWRRWLYRPDLLAVRP